MSLLAVVAGCGSSSGPSAAGSARHASAGTPTDEVRAVAAQPQSGSAVSSTPTCRTGDLSVRLGPAEGAAGSVYAPLVFTNTGTARCRLSGYPGVSYVAPGNGHQVGAAATRSAQHPAQAVVLAPGGHAAAVVQMVNVMNYPDRRCRPTATSGLRVYPPGNTAATYVAFGRDRSACSTGVAQLSVEAVVAGTSGR
ncbi:MAG TPA: DUF4232 domain-containing protein [Mycobacteriales bacterium]|nr:DUF4232 domain-containing protein [Mycobacteriales bacterium]